MPILFTLLVVFESLLRPGYSQISDEISYLGVGPYSYIQNANFIISGFLAVVFAPVLGAGPLPSPSPPAPGGGQQGGGLAAVIFGVGVVLAGITLLQREHPWVRPSDQRSPHSMRIPPPA